MGLLEGRSAIITGAGQGIGRATALMFAREDAHVMIVDIVDDARLESVRLIEEAGGVAISAHADVTVASDVDAMVAETAKAFGRVDILVNNAGGSWGSTDLDISDEDWQRVFDLNLTSQFLCVRAVVPHMKRQRYGKLIGITSGAGRYKAYSTGLAYAASKGGVHGFHRKLAAELGRWNITANVVSPGNVLTEHGRQWLELPSMRGLLKECPLGRWTEPEELANAILFFASDLSSQVTGVTMDVNGGWLMMW
jgi:NAD(P)-dependent dehydrogenase (short-subunit alcohol dehydrogenase family)